METDNGTPEGIRFPYSGQLEIEIYFKEYKDSCANDCRRFLHMGRGEFPPLINKLKENLEGNADALTIFPKDYALLRHIPISIEVELDAGSRRSGAGKARGGLEIYDVSGLDENVIIQLKQVLENEKEKSKEEKRSWFSYYRIYLRREIL
jgi:hypothetical protein